jgi:hypothetical protein
MPVTKIYNSSDWQIFSYQPEPGSFVLDFSQLNGPDVLGNGSDGLALADYEIGGISISEGADVDYGVIHNLQVSSMQVTFIVRDFTIDDINDFFVGTRIFARVNNGNGTLSPYSDMFDGIIDSVQVDVLPGEDFSTINVSAMSHATNVLNADLGITKNETDLKSVLVNNALAASNITFYVADPSDYNFKGTARESKTVGEWATDLALCDFMQMRDTVRPITVSTGTLETAVVSTFYSPQLFRLKTNGTSAGTLDETNISSVTLDWSGQGSPTGVTLTNYTDSATIYQYGSSQSGAGGSVSYSATVDVKNLAQMTAIGQELLKMTKAFRPISVTATIANEYQELDFKDVNLPRLDLPGEYFNVPYYPENLYFLGDTITIDLPAQGVDNLKMIVVGRTLEITPDNWTTTYNLWKGFTN